MTQTSANRWWENYLVRYLMPSVAGVAIVLWLGSWAGPSFKAALLLPDRPAGFETSGLILLFLYGNLFCYIASYPILGFHATRVVDFERGRWKPNLFDGYVLTAGAAVVVLIISLLKNPNTRLWGAVVVLGLFVLAQLLRLRASLRDFVTADGLSIPASRLYVYAYRLARRRGGAGELTSIGDRGTPTRALWKADLVETYRHLREHGNSAFIFVLELTLAGLCYCIIVPGWQPLEQLSCLAVLFAAWSLPAATIHLVGQQMERRFSLFDGKPVQSTEIAEEESGS